MISRIIPSGSLPAQTLTSLASRPGYPGHLRAAFLLEPHTVEFRDKLREDVVALFAIARSVKVRSISQGKLLIFCRLW